MYKFLNELKYKGIIGFALAKKLVLLKKYFDGYSLPDKKYITKRFFDAHGYHLDLENPKSLNEKLQWLKLNAHKPIYTKLADKFAVREYIKQNFGEQYLVPLCFVTNNYKDIKEDNLPSFPCIVKANHDAANYRIIRNKKNVNWKRLQTDCRWWLQWNYYKVDREFQYNSIPRKIIVEKLLTDKSGKIPNDYKLNYINGNLEFIYVSVDREAGNYRNIYTYDWKPLDFKWAKKKKLCEDLRGPEISPPTTLKEMIRIANEVAKLYPYVRVDFYDVEGKLYIGEITQCHGGGFDKFEPQSIDFEYGKKLRLP